MSMDLEIELKIQRNKLRLKRYESFNWKIYFLKTFGFLLLLDLFMFLTIPQNLSRSGLLMQLAISLWVIMLVCAIFTPIITYWYRTRFKHIISEIKQLRHQKKIIEKNKKYYKTSHKRKVRINIDNSSATGEFD